MEHGLIKYASCKKCGSPIMQVRVTASKKERYPQWDVFCVNKYCKHNKGKTILQESEDPRFMVFDYTVHTCEFCSNRSDQGETVQYAGDGRTICVCVPCLEELVDVKRRLTKGVKHAN